MAAKGYVVVYTEPARQHELRPAVRQHHPVPVSGRRLQDLMAALDDVIEPRLCRSRPAGRHRRQRWRAAHQLGAHQTDRFAAAVSQRSIADWEACWYTADFTLFNPSWFRGPPWQEQKDFAGRSPITHVDKITTPLMLIEGDADYRTPPAAGGEAMFRALKYRSCRR